MTLDADRRLSTGRASLLKKETPLGMNDRTNSSNEPSTASVHQNPMLAFENSKQFLNIPLKDISNQVSTTQPKIQTSGTLTTTKYTANNGSGGGRYSMMPFEIAPKLKINNYLDQPFK